MIGNFLKSMSQAAIANCLCPKCGGAYGPNAVMKPGLGAPEVTCPHCGHVNTSMVLNARPGAGYSPLSTTDPLNPTEPVPQPPQTESMLSELPDGGLLIEIPPGKRREVAARTVKLGGLISGIMMLLVVGVLLKDRLDPIFMIVLGLMAVSTIVIDPIIRKKMVTKLKSSTRLVLTRDGVMMELLNKDGTQAEPPRSIPLGEVRTAIQTMSRSGSGQVGRKRRRSNALYAIDIAPAPDSPHPGISIGDQLNKEESTWLTWILRDRLTQLGNSYVLPKPNPKDQS